MNPLSGTVPVSLIMPFVISQDRARPSAFYRMHSLITEPDQKPDPDGTLIYQTGDTVVTVRPWTKRNPICYESWASRGSRWIAGETPPEVQNDTGGDSKSPDKKKQKKDDATAATLGAKRLFAEVSGPRGTAIWDLGGSGDCGSNGKQKWKVRGGNP